MGRIKEVEVQRAKKDLSMWQSKELHDQQVLEDGLVGAYWVAFFFSNACVGVSCGMLPETI